MCKTAENYTYSYLTENLFLDLHNHDQFKQLQIKLSIYRLRLTFSFTVLTQRMVNIINN